MADSVEETAGNNSADSGRGRGEEFNQQIMSDRVDSDNDENI